MENTSNIASPLFLECSWRYRSYRLSFSPIPGTFIAIDELNTRVAVCFDSYHADRVLRGLRLLEGLPGVESELERLEGEIDRLRAENEELKLGIEKLQTEGVEEKFEAGIKRLESQIENLQGIINSFTESFNKLSRV